jgi:hypothetical protein
VCSQRPAITRSRAASALWEERARQDDEKVEVDFGDVQEVAVTGGTGRRRSNEDLVQLGSI